MYSVEWLQSALNELTRLWLSAGPASRSEVTRISSAMARRLSTDPYGGDSESRDTGTRILIERPLAITFREEADGRTITVIHVWAIRPLDDHDRTAHA